jgi:hypothetical protein
MTRISRFPKNPDGFPLPLVLALAAACGLCACDFPGRATGGGTIPSVSGMSGQKANFGFTAQWCDGTYKGQFNFHDKDAFGFQPGGVKMSGEVTQAGKEAGGTGGYGISVSYTSRNPFFPGTGIAYIYVVDNGQGAKATSADSVQLYVDSGPFAGYLNTGSVQGNIRLHDCD